MIGQRRSGAGGVRRTRFWRLAELPNVAKALRLRLQPSCDIFPFRDSHRPASASSAGIGEELRGIRIR